MLSLDRRMSFEVEFNQVAIAVAEMLARQMNDISLDLGRDGETDPYDPSHSTAEAANHIVALCRWLTDEIRRYERCDRQRRDAEDEYPF